jgi:hypothetical protein
MHPRAQRGSGRRSRKNVSNSNAYSNDRFIPQRGAKGNAADRYSFLVNQPTSCSTDDKYTLLLREQLLGISPHSSLASSSSPFSNAAAAAPHADKMSILSLQAKKNNVQASSSGLSKKKRGKKSLFASMSGTHGGTKKPKQRRAVHTHRQMRGMSTASDSSFSYSFTSSSSSSSSSDSSTSSSFNVDTSAIEAATPAHKIRRILEYPTPREPSTAAERAAMLPPFEPSSFSFEVPRARRTSKSQK